MRFSIVKAKVVSALPHQVTISELWGPSLPTSPGDLPTRPLGKLAYLHDKGSPTVTFTRIPSFPFIGLVTLRENSNTQEHSSYSRDIPDECPLDLFSSSLSLLISSPQTNSCTNLVSDFLSISTISQTQPLLPWSHHINL